MDSLHKEASMQKILQKTSELKNEVTVGQLRPDHLRQ